MQPFWMTSGGPNTSAGVLRSALAAADTQGLNPQDYAVDELGRLWDSKDVESLARLELLLTSELGNYASDLIVGRHQPRDFDPKAFPTACDCEIDAPGLLERALAAPDLKVFLEEQAPPFDEYRGLRGKLAEYRAIAARGGWPQVPAGPSLKPGAKDPCVAAVRKRLAVTGEWPGDGPGDGTEYDQTLVEAVRRFQRYHGLDPDGVVGPATLAALNVPVEQRIRQLVINMESWRWVARDHGDWWVTVNIPSFRLTALRGGKVELSMSVIVGDEYHMTPVFSDKLRYVEVNPYWEVPLSIAQKEFLPRLRKDPAYLKKEHIRIFEGWHSGADEVDSAAVDWAKVTPDDMGRYRLRQDPRPGNSLGRVAFIFPNAFDVYLHDTPAVALFGLTKRTFSHGCIRVSKPYELAAYILGGPGKGWTEEKILGLIADSRNQIIHLEASLPIYILYNTAVVDPEGGGVYFYEDVYGRDALLEKAIF
jgi:murein L,D-transpeptidase YcbB/YkuD